MKKKQKGFTLVKSNKKYLTGFSLIELFIVIAILAILATLVVMNIANARKKSNDTKAFATMSATQREAANCIANGEILNMYSYDDTINIGNQIPFILTGGRYICGSSGLTFPDFSQLKLVSMNGKYWALAKRPSVATNLLYGYAPDSDNMIFTFAATNSCTAYSGSSCLPGIPPIDKSSVITCYNNGCIWGSYSAPNTKPTPSYGSIN